LSSSEFLEFLGFLGVPRSSSGSSEFLGFLGFFGFFGSCPEFLATRLSMARSIVSSKAKDRRTSRALSKETSAALRLRISHGAGRRLGPLYPRSGRCARSALWSAAALPPLLVRKARSVRPSGAEGTMIHSARSELVREPERKRRQAAALQGGCRRRRNRGTPRNSEELRGTRGTPRNPRNSEELRGTPRNSEELRGTPRNSEELRGTISSATPASQSSRTSVSRLTCLARAAPAYAPSGRGCGSMPRRDRRPHLHPPPRAPFPERE
jgi:hypothetical protein